MSVDEFGREVPHVNLQRAPSPDLQSEHYKYRRHRESPHHQQPRRPERARPPIVERYVSKPMCCEEIWKKKMKDREDEDTLMDVEGGQVGQPAAKETYDEYRQRYCLKYIQEFFNTHMDDSWFRNRYSPLARKRLVLQHLDRAALEAHKIGRDLNSTPDLFVAQSSLGSGIKDRQKRKHGEPESASGVPNVVPNSHVFSFQGRVVKMLNIPPHVSEKQITLALLDHSSNPHAEILIFSESIRVNDQNIPLCRDAFCIFESAEVKREIISDIQKKASSEPGRHVPRKDESHKHIELDVECADPYGRLEVEDEAGGAVTHRKASILLDPVELTQKVEVLSAAVSSKTRIAKDKEATLIIARALDMKHKIPQEVRLDALIQPLRYEDEIILDVSIAYLRRVHLFSFYNGCVLSDNLADVLSQKHPASIIHLRLKNADDILHKPNQEYEGEQPHSTTKDLLVMRLDEGIRKAVENAVEWATNEYFVSPEVDAEAVEIEELEKQSELEWVKQHSIDEEGRARCGFHFCRKLFKEMNFLEKHLYKKHSEFLHAETAKCHDSFMMRAWESGDIRPVPRILVDCGSNFGLRESQVIGALTPMAEDPEPALWQEHKHQTESQRHRHPRDSDGQGDGLYVAPPPRRSNFEDVDDMKEEKVELSFENIEVPVQQPKKKKRKKLL